jgi:hypothetical protein
MSGGNIFVLTVVQLALTAVPGIAAALLAVRGGVRDVPVLLCIGLAGSGAMAMGTFWVYYAVPDAGSLCAYTVFFGSIAAIGWAWPRVSQHRDLLRRLSVPLGLWALATLFIVFFGFLHGGAEEAIQTASARFSTQPNQMASDSSIPLFFSDWMFAGHPGPPPLFPPDWLFSDRPPLQLAYVLTQRVFGWDATTLHYELLGVILQQFWIVAMWALLTAARTAARTRALVMIGALVSDVAILNGFYVWPKLLGAAFVLAALALLVPPGEPRLRSQPLTIVLLGALAGLAFLSHGTSAFGLVPVLAVALWRGLPGWRWLAAGAAAALVLVGPWMAYQHYENPPGNRLLKWSLAGSPQVDGRGAVETILDEYGKAGVGGTVENKLQNFLTMAGGSPATGLPAEGQLPFGDVLTETGDAVSAVADGRFGAAASKVREIRHWHLLWTFALLLLAVPAIVAGRLRGRVRDDADWRFAGFCLLVFAIGAVGWGLLMFGNVAGRAVLTSGSLALPLVGIAGLVAGLRATYPRWAAWLVGANAVTVLALFLPTLAAPAGSYSAFAMIVVAASLAGFLALAHGRLACPGSWTSSTP